MPLYEYECDAQHHRFEMIRKFSDPPIETCPTCGSTVHKLIAAPAFQLKGTGWYITDYAKKADGAAKNEPAPAKDAATPAADKTEKSDKSENADKGEKSQTAAAPAPAASADKSAS